MEPVFEHNKLISVVVYKLFSAKNYKFFVFNVRS